MKKILFTIISFFIILSVNAQVNKEHYLGLSGSVYSGYGFAYRQMQDKIGFQVNLAPYVSSNSQIISAGISVMYKLSDYEKTNLLLTAGNHFFMNNSEDNSRFTYLYGFGPCLQYNLSGNLFFELMLGYGGRYKINDKNNNYGESRWSFSYTGGASILYRINKKTAK